MAEPWQLAPKELRRMIQAASILSVYYLGGLLQTNEPHREVSAGGRFLPVDFWRQF
jgi:hypothetical protein